VVSLVLEVTFLARVLVSFRVLPSDVSVDLNVLKGKIEDGLPKFASVHKFVEEPIAFGLTALIVHIIMPEERSGGVDEVEKSLLKIEEVNEIESLMVRRI